MLRISAYFFSVIFHPLLIPTYMLILLLMINPYVFGVNHLEESGFLIAQVVLTTLFLPLFSVFMLRQLDFISSIEMPKKEERIAPYLIIGMFYIGLVVFFIKSPGIIPNVLSIAFLGATIGLWVLFLLNLFIKVSAHTVGIGGLLGLVVIGTFFFEYNQFIVDLGVIGIYNVNMKAILMITLLIAGLVGTSRLILKAHTPEQVYIGYFIGFISQFLAFNFLN